MTPAAAAQNGLGNGYRFHSVIADGRVAALDPVATRRLPAAALMLGRTPSEALALTRTLHAACPRAQEIATARALEAALGQPAPDARETTRDAALLAEAAFSLAFTLLAVWPAFLGRPPVAPPLTALRAAARAVAAAETGPVRAAALAGLRAAADEAARAFGALDLPNDPAPSPAPSPLPLLPAEWYASRLGDQRFAMAPSLDGSAREPGVAARAGAPLSGPSLNASRLLARQAELAAIAAGENPFRHGGVAVLNGEAVSVVETARGPLAVLVVVRGGHIARFASVAPTEWLMHPDGALARAVVGLPDDATLPGRAGAALAALDPCCPCRISADDRVLAAHA